jgi:hypothetical protein
MEQNLKNIGLYNLFLTSPLPPPPLNSVISNLFLYLFT